jgi:hypothetical protein
MQKSLLFYYCSIWGWNTVQKKNRIRFVQTALGFKQVSLNSPNYALPFSNLLISAGTISAYFNCLTLIEHWKI